MCSLKRDVLKDFIKSTGKTMCWSLLFYKITGLKPEVCNFVKKETLAQVPSCKFYKIWVSIIFMEYIWWLFLNIISSSQCILVFLVKFFLSSHTVSTTIESCSLWVKQFCFSLFFMKKTYIRVNQWDIFYWSR